MEKTVFVSAEKLERAKDIVGLLTGKIIPRNLEEKARIEHYALVCQAKGIDLKNENKSIAAIYLTLGGLMRTEAEEEEAQTKKKEMQVKGKKDKMGLRG